MHEIGLSRATRSAANSRGSVARTASKGWCAATLVALLAASYVNAGAAPQAEDPTPTVEWGAAVFVERCVLCHGRHGTGDGRLAQTVKGYPSTDLFRRMPSGDELTRTIVWGGTRAAKSPFSPPFGSELSWSEIESLLLFVQMLYSDEDTARSLVDRYVAGAPRETETSEAPTRVDRGRTVYESRCALCHGPYGKGDGRLAKAIKDPPPYNLTASVMPEPYLRLIVAEGGAALGRSGHMPPWKDELTAEEIDLVVSFIMTLRNKD